MGLYLKEFVRTFGDEVKSLNFYGYAQWWLLITLIAEIVTVILLLVGVIEKTYARPAGDVAVGFLSTAFILAIVALELLLFDVENPRRILKHESLFNVIFWAFLDLLHWLGFAFDLPYMVSGACLAVAVVCYMVACLLCQARRRTALTGGTGVEYMMLVLPAYNMKGKKTGGRA